MTTEIDRLIERLKVDAEEANFLVRSIAQMCAGQGVDVQAITGKSAQDIADRGVSEISADILEAISTLELLKPMLAERERLIEALGLGVVSLTSFDGHCVRIDFPNREEAERMMELLGAAHV